MENLYNIEQDITLQRVVFESKPLLLEYSVNNLCNLRCIMCAPTERTKTTMPETFIKDVLIDGLLPHAVALMPSMGSEPFLGDLSLLGEGCRRHEVQLNLVTNGTLITRSKLEAIAPCIGRMQISLDGHYAKLYESIRVGGKFDTVMENTRIAAEIARREGFELMLSTVYSTGMARAMPDYVRFAVDLGVDSVAFQRMHHSTPTACEMDAFLSMKEEEIREEKERAVRVAEENGVDIHFDFWPSVGFHFNQRPHRVFIRDVIESWLLKTFPDFCFMAASYANINQIANVTPCCIPGPDLLMGNLLQQNPMEVWNGENFGKLRKSFFTKEYFKTCRGCPHLRRGEWSAGRSSDDDSP